MRKKNKLPTQNTSKIDTQGLPDLLIKIRGEPLNHVLSVKVQESLGNFVEAHGGCEFIRTAILEKLEKIVNKPSPAKCSECANLTDYEGKDFCLVALAFVGEKTLLTQPFSCEYFKKRKGL